MHSRDANSDGELLLTHMVKFCSVSLEKMVGLGLSFFLERVDNFDFDLLLRCATEDVMLCMVFEKELI
jgi:hypothetical protein